MSAFPCAVLVSMPSSPLEAASAPIVEGNMPPDPISSETLLRQYQAGDELALEKIWERYLPRLKRWASARLSHGSRADASTDDLIQDAFVRSLAPLRRLEPRGPHSLFAYIKRLVRSSVIDRARTVKRRPQREILEPERHAHRDPTPLEMLIGQEVWERYQRALATLSEEDQQMILVFVELRCSDRELAELFGKSSPDAARMARGRAIARLAKAMENLVRTVPPERSGLSGGADA
jgi:RNA polymerase sigma factor (sigma-70 family)